MKYVLLTGAHGGMGSASVDTFVNNGYFVFALDKIEVAKQENVLPIIADITSEEDLQKAFSLISTYTDTLSAIIHFSGIYLLDSLIEIEKERYDKIVDVNIKGAYLVNKTFFSMLKNDSRILLTTSELAPLNPLPFTGLYAMTKKALDTYAYALKMELDLLGIQVSVLRAGAVDTTMLKKSQAELNNFLEHTKNYHVSANNFERIVNKVETKNVAPSKIANKVYKIVNKKKQKFAYSINRNKLLVLLNILPSSLQFYIIKRVLQGK